MRLGIIGMDSTRPLRVARHLQSLTDSGHALKLIVDEGDELPVGMRDLVPDVEIVRSPSEVIGRVDAVFDLGRRAAVRRERIAPLLRTGIHAFVDKPLALTRSHADALIDAAREGRASLSSDSGYRLAVTRGEAHESAEIRVSGPADAESPWGGLAFYGMHHAQIVDEIRPGPGDWTVVDVTTRAASVTALVDVAPGLVRLAFEPEAAGFSLAYGTERRPLVPPVDYLEQLVDRFLASCATPPHDEAWARQLRRPVAILEDISAVLAERASGAN